MFKPRKVGWSDLGRRGLREGGGNCLKYLKGVEQKRGEGSKDFKKRGQAGSRCGCLKKVGQGWNPLTNYNYQINSFENEKHLCSSSFHIRKSFVERAF